MEASSARVCWGVQARGLAVAFWGMAGTLVSHVLKVNSFVASARKKSLGQMGVPVAMKTKRAATSVAAPHTSARYADAP